MTFIVLIMIFSVVAILPFVWLRKPWALKLWSRAKTIAVIYAVIILTSGIVRLIMNWDQIYG